MGSSSSTSNIMRRRDNFNFFENATSLTDAMKYYDYHVKFISGSIVPLTSLKHELIKSDNFIVFKEYLDTTVSPLYSDKLSGHLNYNISLLSMDDIQLIIDVSAIQILTYLFTIPSFVIDIFHTNEIRNYLISIIPSYEIINILVKNGFNINIQDNNGNTILMKCCSSILSLSNSYQFISNLYENGASITIKNHLNQTCIDTLNVSPILRVCDIYLRNDILKLFSQMPGARYHVQMYLTNKLPFHCQTII
jgi:hypothetical protein